jgi:hypothetical protein
MQSKNVIVLSLGQLTNSSTLTSINRFAQLSAEHSYFPYFLSYPYYWVNTALRYSYDYLWRGTIAKYKIGEISTPEFINFLTSQLSSSLSKEEITQGWNAMCYMGEKEKTNLNSLIKFLNEHGDVTAIIISYTNNLQFDYINGQMSSAFSTLVNNRRIVFSTSFEHKEASLPKLLTKTTEAMGIIDKIYSFHRTIDDKAKDNERWAAKFTCTPFNPSKDSLESNLEKANNFF